MITRRSALALSVLAIAGCRSKATPPARPTPTPDAAALGSARATERQLIAMYDAQIATAAAGVAEVLTAARDAHATHLTALGGGTAAPAGSPLPSFAGVKAVLQQSATTLRTAAIDAADGNDAAVFASIAASHAVSAA